MCVCVCVLCVCVCVCVVCVCVCSDAAPADLALIPNVTTGVNSVVKSVCRHFSAQDSLLSYSTLLMVRQFVCVCVCVCVRVCVCVCRCS